ncbi:MAG: DUF4192 domain-containing protein [Nocardioides sp.]
MTAPTTLTARNPADLLAVVRVVLGFEPADSIVMLTLGARHSCHARVDLPAGPHELAHVADLLLRPASGHGAAAVVFVLFTDDDRRARRSTRVLRQLFERAGVHVLEALRAHDGRWYPLLSAAPRAGAGVPYDVSSHPFVAAAVLDGRVLHDSREALAATLVGRPEDVAAVERALPQPEASGTWVSRLVSRHAVASTAPTDAEAARLLVAVADPHLRDAAWARIPRADARRHVELWSGLVRRCPADLIPHAAGVLGIAAWLAGDGALAWCAVDRGREIDAEHSLVRLVADLLEGAVPPAEWERRAPGMGSAS